MLVGGMHGIHAGIMGGNNDRKNGQQDSGQGQNRAQAAKRDGLQAASGHR